MITRRALIPCSLVLLALAPACHGKAPTAAPGNAPGGRAERAPRWPSFMDTHHHGGGSRRCAAADYERASAKAGEPAAARAEAWATVADTCWFDWQGEERAIDGAGLAAYVGYGTALLEAGFPHDCEALMTSVTTPYPGGMSDVEVTEELQPLVDDALALGERCGAAAEAQLAAFAPPTCPSDDACFALVEGEAPADDGAADPDDPDAEMIEDVVCPEVELRTAAGARRLSSDEGALVDPGFCCGVSAITTAIIDGQRYVLVRPSGEDSMFIRVCSGGTASATPASVYRVDGDRLVLEADRSLVWH
ncbi:MAG: hypothetical protein IPH44_32820 [Myxococcales bacterium]|nr:hypothetical protein [Myxococcales bacterium]MBK7193413.1 hypothetical protein [Myxococcales bacterium]MBP6844116.1 hypothetical protein [Kofleriaceae bacterium]